MSKTLSGYYDYTKKYMKQATTAIIGQAVVWPYDYYITQPQSHTQFGA